MSKKWHTPYSYLWFETVLTFASPISRDAINREKYILTLPLQTVFGQDELAGIYAAAEEVSIQWEKKSATLLSTLPKNSVHVVVGDVVTDIRTMAIESHNNETGDGNKE